MRGGLLAFLALLSASPWVIAVAGTPLSEQRIDSPRANAGFSLRVALVRTLTGRFDYLEGVIVRDAARQRFSVDVRLAVLSLYMANPEHARWAQSAEFFDAERHPWIRFYAEDVPEAVLHEGGLLHGELSLRGQTRAASFEIDPPACERPGEDCPVLAHGEIKRSEFGMGARRLVVSDTVRLRLGIRLRETAP